MEEENDAKGIGTNLRMFLPIMGNNRFVMHKVSSIKIGILYLNNHYHGIEDMLSKFGN